MEDDRQYYLRRAAEERQAAERAGSGAAERSHRTLAERYAQQVEATERTGGPAPEPTA